MDPISQAAIGATAAQSLSPKTGLKAALLAGAIGGTMPDLDVLIRSTDDPLLFLDYHRHFTHSLAFIPLGGVIAAAVARVVLRGRRSLKQLWAPATLGWATHGLLDSCTSYGTFLLWPFSSARIAWHNVAIIDPLFTLPLVAGALLAMRRKNRTLARAAFTWGVLYLLFGAVQRDRAAAVYASVQAERGHKATRPRSSPVSPITFSFGASICTTVATMPTRYASPGLVSRRSTKASRSRPSTSTSSPLSYRHCTPTTSGASRDSRRATWFEIPGNQESSVTSAMPPYPIKSSRSGVWISPVQSQVDT